MANHGIVMSISSQRSETFGFFDAITCLHYIMCSLITRSFSKLNTCVEGSCDCKILT